MFKNLVWNKLQFVANPGLVSIVLYRVILQLNSVVRLNSTERIIRINLCCFILQLPRLSSQFKLWARYSVLLRFLSQGQVRKPRPRQLRIFLRWNSLFHGVLNFNTQYSRSLVPGWMIHMLSKIQLPVIFIVSETFVVNFNIKYALASPSDFRISIRGQFTFYTTKLEMLIQNILQICSGESKTV
ncbi:Hypothetical_protein [Hexamita inflata]|uniref:Hypothetical_protein n=1 Tax=Hexamita inflata TaxID=28002 RepID=A0AA86TRB7_9EUKA|nr:Hypothetical protein HINF_LOCUS13366 [Hexamita inflata]